jgi:hypothetical protein
VARSLALEETEAAHRKEEAAVIPGLRLTCGRYAAADPSMSLLTSLEFIISDPAHQLAL